LSIISNLRFSLQCGSLSLHSHLSHLQNNSRLTIVHEKVSKKSADGGAHAGARYFPSFALKNSPFPFSFFLPPSSIYVCFLFFCFVDDLIGGGDLLIAPYLYRVLFG
jgi:hypothetical protein